MATADFSVLAFYLIGMIVLGLYYAGKNKTTSDMFAAGGQAPWWVAGLSSFMTMFSAGTFVVWGGIAYKFGWVAVMINLSYGVAALVVGYFVAGKWKAMGLRTPAQFVEIRFGRAAVALYTSVLMVYRLIGSGIALYALALLICALIPLPEGSFLQDPQTGNLSVLWATVLFGSIVVIYTMLGGLWAVLMTDVLQFIILNLAVLFLVPIILWKVGGVTSFVAAAPVDFFNLTGGGYGYLFILGWTIIHIFLIGAEWAFAQRFISVPSSKDARKSAYLFAGLYLLSPILWLAPPMIYRVIDPTANPEQAYILAAHYALPAGMVGLVMAAMFSATASLVSSQLNVFAGVLTDPVTQKLGITESRSVWLGRSLTVLLGGVVMIIAVMVPFLGGAERVVISTTSLLVGPMLAPSLWGLFSRRIDMRAVWISTVSAALIGGITKIGMAPNGLLADWSLTREIAGWTQNNTGLLDLLIGVVTPIFVLSLYHMTVRKEAYGAMKLDQHVDNADANLPEGESENVFGIVALCVGASGLLMIVLAMFQASERVALTGFGLVLMALAGVFGLASRRLKLAAASRASSQKPAP